MYRLIIADDEENIRNGMAHSLPWREWGYEVVALCASGQEVLDQMESARPDVVLSDIRMPGMDGVELMQRLSRDYPQVKIVILSGYSDFKYLNMSIRNYVAEYLLKPTDVDDFEETFRRLKASMDHERLRRAQITESVLRQQIIHGRKPKAEANYRSTGIGLHNIGARLRLYAGSTSCIKVQSKPGFGTRVTLELPWRDVEQPEPS